GYQHSSKYLQCSADERNSYIPYYQQMLHRNLVYLATIADSNQNMQSLLPAVSIYSQSPI
uniref:SS18 N-terminal domain-containing protein n=1 Tax=Sinocyclocheilus grahami TaxID=75366 RepID=A0A672P2P4_SINGR